VTAEYFAPAFRVEVDGAGLAPNVSNNVLDVSVSTQPSAIDHFSLTLANPFPELPWTHTDKGKQFQEGGSVKISLGYVNGLEPLFDGEITSVSPSFPESGAPTVKVEGLSRLHWLDNGTKLRTFQDMTDKDIFEKIAKERNLTPQSDATPTKHRYLAQTNLSDFRFLLARARWLRFELLSDGKNIIFRKANESEAKTYALVWGNPQEGLRPDAKVLPLRSFNPTLNSREPVSSVVVRGQDSSTGEAIEERAGKGDEDASMGGESAADVGSGTPCGQSELVISDQPVASREEARELARAEYNRRARRLVSGHGTSIGIPDLRSGNVIELRGLGRFSGLYYVTSVSHRIGANGYETSFDVERSSIG
jgi:Bacteriophage probable baseplate hub protein